MTTPTSAPVLPPPEELEECIVRALREDNPEWFQELARALPVFPTRYHVGQDDLLTVAIRHNARHCIEPLAGMGFSMNRLSPRHNKHPLEEAMDAKANLVIEYLLEFGSDPNSPHSRHGTVMRAAAVTRTIDSLIPILCSRDGNPNIPNPDDGSTPLHAAVAHGETLNVEQFLDSGADVNAVDLIGRTPLQLAITRLDECEPIATILLDHGANPLIPDFGGLTAVDLAKVRGEYGLIDLLGERINWEALLAPPGPPPHSGTPRLPDALRRALLIAVDQGDQRQLRDLFQLEAKPWNPVQAVTESPLLAAFAKKRLDLAAPLIARGLGIEDTDPQKRNAVYYLLTATNELALLKPFLDALHRQVPNLLAAREENGHTQAVAAMHKGGLSNPKAVEMLIEEIRRPAGSPVSPAEAERRRRMRLANRAKIATE